MSLLNLNGFFEYLEKKENNNDIQSINIINVVSRKLEIEKVIKEKKDYEKKDIIDILLLSNYSIEIKDLVKQFEKSIVALAYGPGSPFATGLLIHPKYVLTTSYSIRKQFLNQLSIRYDYQKTLIKIQGNSSLQPTMDLGEIIKVKKIYERNNEIGYCILELEKSLPESYDFNPNLNLFLTPDQSMLPTTNDCLLFSHPSSGPKRVSFNFDKDRDSIKLKGDDGFGSSGGIFITKSGEITSMVNLVENNDDENQFSLISINSIYEKSQLLQLIFPKGKYEPQPSIPSIDDLVDIDDGDERVQVTRGKFPGPKANENNNTGIQFSYHHIVPAGYQDFLWYLSIEVPKISQLLSEIYQNDAKINYVVWSKWNLFQGPSYRFHKSDLIAYLKDPNAKGFDPSDGIEEYKPISFNQTLWDFNQDVFTLLNQCWDERNLITKKSKKETIAFIDKNYKSNNLEDLIAEELEGHSTEKYEQAINNIYNKLDGFKLDLSSYQELGVHQYEENDWISVDVGGKNKFKYYLK